MDSTIAEMLDSIDTKGEIKPTNFHAFTAQTLKDKSGHYCLIAHTSICTLLVKRKDGIYKYRATKTLEELLTTNGPMKDCNEEFPNLLVLPLLCKLGRMLQLGAY